MPELKRKIGGVEDAPVVKGEALRAATGVAVIVELEPEVEAELALMQPHEAAPIREAMVLGLGKGAFKPYDFLKYDHWGYIRRKMVQVEAHILLARVADKIRAAKARERQ